MLLEIICCLVNKFKATLSQQGIIIFCLLTFVHVLFLKRTWTKVKISCTFAVVDVGRILSSFSKRSIYFILSIFLSMSILLFSANARISALASLHFLSICCRRRFSRLPSFGGSYAISSTSEAVFFTKCFFLNVRVCC